MNKMEIKPIAKIKTDFTDKFGIPRQSGRIEQLIGTIVFEKEFADKNCIKGIEQYSHLWLIWGFSENVSKEKHATVRPPRLGGNERIGVFATRSPFRPNNLGLSCVKLICANTSGAVPTLTVAGADMLNGTPIYDIKPYIPYSDSVQNAKYGFAEREQTHKLEVLIEDEQANKIPADKRDALYGILADDPRPAYQDDENRIYGMKFAEFEIKFTVCKNKLEVKSIEKATKK